MDREHHQHHGGGFANGFLFGLIIGAALVFFLFTDKGKKLLKTITEEGIEGIADIKDLVGEEMDDEEYEEESYPVEPVREEHHAPSKIKRLFKGIKK